MKILIVASYNKSRFAPFIVEQAEALRRAGCIIEFYGITGKGIRGYLKSLPSLKAKIAAFEPDIIHAHYGLSGLLSNLQRSVPVVTTYHGSDINEVKNRPFSCLSMWLSAWNIFVSQKTLSMMHPSSGYSLIPCGVDLSEIQLTGRNEARAIMGLSASEHYILFAGAFDNAIKSPDLAKLCVSELDEDVKLIELKGYTREQVTYLMCAADVFLLTSKMEGSPQVIKEAMLCGCPIVSTDVGDVSERISGLAGCYVSKSRDAKELSSLIKLALAFKGRTKGRARIKELGLDNSRVAEELLLIYALLCRRAS